MREQQTLGRRIQEARKAAGLSQESLGERLGVSRTPVREAFQTLEAEGLIELRMNRGAIVKTIDEKYITDHYEMRILLESEAAKRAAARATSISFAPAKPMTHSPQKGGYRPSLR